MSFEIRPLAQEERSFKDFSSFSSGGFCSAERNHYGNFGKTSKQFFENYFEIEQLAYQEMSF